MALHLIKLCVGVDTLEELREWRAQRAAAGHKPVVPTRQTPKRAADIVDGGSLFWVIKGQIMVRQTITGIRTLDSGHQPCRIDLDPLLVPTYPHPRRAFQGWRYLEPKDAPADLPSGALADMPEDLARQLRELGAW
jgi:hypothetical protein